MPMNETDAEEYTASLGQIVSGSWRQIALAKRLGVPKALGLTTRQWVDERLGGYVKLGVAERREAVADLLEEGYSQREAAEVLGVTDMTVHRDLSATNVVPEEAEQAGLPADGATNVADDRSLLDATATLSANEQLARTSREPQHQAQPDDDWYTPRWLFDQLGLVFDLDVCAPTDPKHRTVPARDYYTEDGITQPWHGTVWCNPPYSAPGEWATRWCAHGDGLLLTHIPANASWAVEVWQRATAAVWLQALEFVRPNGSVQRPGYALQLAAIGDPAVAALSSLRAPKSGPVWRRVNGVDQ